MVAAIVLLVLAGALCAVSPATAGAAAQQPSPRSLDTPPAVFNYEVVPDGSTVIALSLSVEDDVLLHALPVRGGPAVPLGTGVGLSMISISRPLMLAGAPHLPWAVITDDSGRVVFWHSDGATGQYQLRSVATDGAGAVELARAAEPLGVLVSADASRVVFATDEGGAQTWWSVAADGSDLRRMDLGDASWVSLTAAADAVLAIVTDEADDDHLVAAPTTGDPRQVLAAHERIRQAFPTTDGSEIFFTYSDTETLPPGNDTFFLGHIEMASGHATTVRNDPVHGEIYAAEAQGVTLVRFDESRGLAYYSDYAGQDTGLFRFDLASGDISRVADAPQVGHWWDLTADGSHAFSVSPFFGGTYLALDHDQWIPLDTNVPGSFVPSRSGPFIAYAQRASRSSSAPASVIFFDFETTVPGPGRAQWPVGFAGNDNILIAWNPESIIAWSIGDAEAVPILAAEPGSKLQTPALGPDGTTVLALQLNEDDPGHARSDRERQILVADVDVMCGGQMATIVGTPGHDVISGTEGPDVIYAGFGDDAVDALAGGDIVCGGAGADTIRGGPGRDQISGGTGADIIRGQQGRDTIRGGPGPDQIFGGPARDSCIGASVRDIVSSCGR